MYFFPEIIINQFHASDLFLHLLKTKKNLWFERWKGKTFFVIWKYAWAFFILIVGDGLNYSVSSNEWFPLFQIRHQSIYFRE